MSGHKRPGVRQFVAKEGVSFDAAFKIRVHSDELQRASQLKRPDESLADYIRAALREKMLRDARRQ